MIEGETYGSSKARQSVVQELCEKHQYDFCETSKVIYKIKDDMRRLEMNKDVDLVCLYPVK